MQVLKPYLFVQREDESEFPSESHYDYKDDFKTYKEACKYKDKCSRQWINHWDVVYATVYHSYGQECEPYGEVVNLSEIPYNEIKAFCAENGILYE